MNIVINADTISVIGAVIAFISMSIALISAFISGRNLNLQKKLYKETTPNFKMNEILNSYAIYDGSNQIVRLMFYPLIMNISSKPMIIEKIRLELIGEESNVFLRPIIIDGCISDGHNVPSNSADTNWICFEINEDVYTELKVLKYELIIEDAFNNLQKVSTSWLKEVIQENENLS